MAEGGNLGAEVFVETEARIQPTKGKREFESKGNKVEINFIRFSGEQNPQNDPKKAAFLLTGWPMRADAQITWGHPQILASEFGINTYEIDGRPKGSFKGDSIALELEGIRQYAQELERTGVNELTLFGHSIGASKAVDLALALEQGNPNLKTNVVLINPLGLFEKGIKELANNYWREAPEVEDRTKNPDRISQGRAAVVKDICLSIFKDIKALKLRYPRLLLDQIQKLSQLNPNLSKLRSPVLIMMASEDPVSELEKVFPKSEIDKIAPPAEANENSRTQMARVGKARDQYAREKFFPQAADVRVIVATKYANHIAFGVERPKFTSHIIARHFDRLKAAAQ